MDKQFKYPVTRNKALLRLILLITMEDVLAHYIDQTGSNERHQQAL